MSVPLHLVMEAQDLGIVPGAIVNNWHRSPSCPDFVVPSVDKWHWSGENIAARGRTLYNTERGWATVVTPAPVDDIIRVGDRVTHISSDWDVPTATPCYVHAISEGVATLREGEFLGGGYCLNKLKKIKSGSDSTQANKNTNNEQVSRTAQAQGSSSRDGRAVELRVRGGQGAVGKRYQGYPQATERPRADAGKGSFRPASRK